MVGGHEAQTRVRRLKRPYPKIEDLTPEEPTFTPAADLALWVQLTFIEPTSPMFNPDHAHLRDASIGFLWANVTNRRQGRTVLGMAQLGKVTGADAWKRGRTEQQLREWFGAVPDFVITLDGDFCMQAGNPEFCALLEHEIYHCAQAVDIYGMPKFNEEGKPVWWMRGHDIEEFVGVVARYGADATRVREFADAAAKGPTVAAADVQGACGVCLRLVA